MSSNVKSKPHQGNPHQQGKHTAPQHHQSKGKAKSNKKQITPDAIYTIVFCVCIIAVALLITAIIYKANNENEKRITEKPIVTQSTVQTSSAYRISDIPGLTEDILNNMIAYTTKDLVRKLEDPENAMRYFCGSDSNLVLYSAGRLKCMAVNGRINSIVLMQHVTQTTQGRVFIVYQYELKYKNANAQQYDRSLVYVYYYYDIAIEQTKTPPEVNYVEFRFPDSNIFKSYTTYNQWYDEVITQESKNWIELDRINYNEFIP